MKTWENSARKTPDSVRNVFEVIIADYTTILLT